MNISANNLIYGVLKNYHITPEHLAKIAYNKGYDSVNDFLAYFEPKQEYTQEQMGAGEGTPATQVEHYIDMSGNNQHNPGQYINPIGFPSGGSPHNVVKSCAEGGHTEEIDKEDSKKKLPTGIKKKKKSSEQVGNTLGSD